MGRYTEVDSVKGYGYCNGVFLEAGIMANGGMNEYVKFSITNSDNSDNKDYIQIQEVENLELFKIKLTPNVGTVLVHAGDLKPNEYKTGHFETLSSYSRKLSEIEPDDEKYSNFIKNLVEESNNTLNNLRQTPEYISVIGSSK